MLGARTESECNELMKEMSRHVRGIERTASDSHDTLLERLDQERARIDGLRREFASLQTDRMTALEIQLKTISKRIDAIEAWRTQFRSEQLSALAEICGDHLNAIDDACKRYDQQLGNTLEEARRALAESTATALIAGRNLEETRTVAEQCNQASLSHLDDVRAALIVHEQSWVAWRTAAVRHLDQAADRIDKTCKASESHVNAAKEEVAIAAERFRSLSTFTQRLRWLVRGG